MKLTKNALIILTCSIVLNSGCGNNMTQDRKNFKSLTLYQHILEIDKGVITEEKENVQSVITHDTEEVFFKIINCANKELAKFIWRYKMSFEIDTDKEVVFLFSENFDYFKVISYPQKQNIDGTYKLSKKCYKYVESFFNSK